MRKQVKTLLGQMEALAPKAKESMLGALTNVRASHLLDRGLWDRLGLDVAKESDGKARAGGAETSGADAPEIAALRTSYGPGGTRRLPVLGGSDDQAEL